VTGAHQKAEAERDPQLEPDVGDVITFEMPPNPTPAEKRLSADIVEVELDSDPYIVHPKYARELDCSTKHVRINGTGDRID